MGPKEVNMHLKLPFPSPERKCVGLKSNGNSLILFSIVPKASADQYIAIHTTTGTTPVKGYCLLLCSSLHFTRAEEDEETERTNERDRQ